MLKKVTDTILYVGENDRDVDLFEGQYDVPNGMAYNSYVILDEKVAVMDNDKYDEIWNAAYAYDKTVEEGEAVYTDANGVQYTRFDTTVTLFMDETFFDLSLEELKLKAFCLQTSPSPRAPALQLVL